MDASQAAAWSALAAAIFSAVAAGASALVSWRAKHSQTSSADFEACLAVVKQLGEAQRHVRDGGEHVRFEFIEYLNLMEALATLVNDGRPGSTTEKVTAHYLEEALSWISITPDIAALMKEATTGDGTFNELRKFKEMRATTIRRTAKHYRDKRDTA